MGVEVIITLECTKVIQGSTCVLVVFNLPFNFLASPPKPVLDKHFSQGGEKFLSLGPEQQDVTKALAMAVSQSDLKQQSPVRRNLHPTIPHLQA